MAACVAELPRGSTLVRGLTNTRLRFRSYVAHLRVGPVVVAGPLFS